MTVRAGAGSVAAEARLMARTRSPRKPASAKTARQTPKKASKAEPAPVAKRERDPAAKRERILEAANELIRERGYRATGTADIAHKAGVSEGLIFHHFGNKHGLLVELASEHGRRLSRVMFEALLPTDDLPVEPMVRSVFEYVRDHQHFHELLLATEDPEDRTSAHEAHRTIIVSTIRATLELWAARGRVRSKRPDIAASLLFGIVQAALDDCFMRGDGSEMDAYVTEAALCCENAVGGALGRE